MDKYDIRGLPTDETDAFCRDFCDSIEKCNDVFGDDYVDLRLKVDFSILQGPGSHLITGVSLGDTIALQSFITQFILDVSSALAASPCRFYVTDVAAGQGHHSWKVTNVVVSFRLFPADAGLIQEFTRQVQFPGSALFSGDVTSATDDLYGLVALRWDASLKLTYAMDVVGTTSVKSEDGVAYLNQGSERHCETPANAGSSICEFESFFIDDVATALAITHDQVDVLFIKPFGLDSVLIQFRFLSTVDGADTIQSTTGAGVDASWLGVRMSDLHHQVQNFDSLLYGGNVTLRTDQTWGVSGLNRHPRAFSPYNPYSYESTSPSSYERCKATHRCTRGWENYDQEAAAVQYTQQHFGGGRHTDSYLFAGFEDWRKGTFSLRQGEPTISPPFDPATSPAPTSAHFDPFSSSTPLSLPVHSVPSYNSTSNIGLVLNNASLTSQIKAQNYWIQQIEDTISFTESNLDIGIMDAVKRSRVDVRRLMSKTRDQFTSLLTAENAKLTTLKDSQCVNEPCEILFNTSSLAMSGALDASGQIVTMPDGVSVAVWVFDSIDLGPNVNVTMTGQRAMVLLSRSTAKIDTNFKVFPGTLGGFPGGYSVGRREADRFSSVCPWWPENGNDFFALQESTDWRIKERCTNDGLTSCCPGDVPISMLTDDASIPSNNVNGPGSGNVRVYLFTVDTSATSKDEIQTVTTSVLDGQNLGGGFRLHFNTYTTGVIPMDTTADEMKQILETDLNPNSSVANLHKIDRTSLPTNLNGVGQVLVSRMSQSTLQGNVYQWKITFTSHVGNPGEIDSTPLTATNLLTGIGADVQVATVQQGNSIAGDFSLSFLSSTTRLMPHDVDAAALQTALKEDIPSLSHVFVFRTDPTNNCNDGFCPNGPTKQGGYTWTLELTTNVGNVSPTFPVSSDFDAEGAVEVMTFANQLTDSYCTNFATDSDCPVVRITADHSLTAIAGRLELTSPRPFSLAFGGGGGGYGGSGGDGFGWTSPGSPYNDERITALLGGSGGQLGYVAPFEANLFRETGDPGTNGRPRGRGGAGGGALEIVAVNDITLGPNGVLNFDGERGTDAFMTAGGGGSGGAVLLSAGGVIRLQGKISVAGGNGGEALEPNGRTDIVNGHGAAGSGGRVAMFAQAITFGEGSSVGYDGGSGVEACSVDGVRNCEGGSGTFLHEESLGHDMFVDETQGAAGTDGSLFLHSSEKMVTSSGVVKRTPFVQHGPEYQIEYGKPGRVTYYVKLGDATTVGNDEVDKDGWGTTFELREEEWTTSADSKGTDNKVLIGVFVGKTFRHGANYYGLPGDTTYDSNQVTFNEYARQEVWYKVDIRINWLDMVYDIYMDDVLRVDKAPFQGGGVRRVGLSTYHHAAVWYDEIYVGRDATMNFRCPKILAEGVEMNRPMQTGWKSSDIEGYSEKWRMERHESHLSRREAYKYNNGGLIPFDGDGHNKYNSDIKFRFADGDHRAVEGGLNAGSLLRVSGAEVPDDEWDRAATSDGGMGGNAWESGGGNKNSGYGVGGRGGGGGAGTKGISQRYMWYGEHFNVDSARDGYESGSDFAGGVAACSTDDFVTWKNEGIMLNYANITDMVLGKTGPFVVERPKVLFNNATSKYVMWMTVDDADKTLGLAGVAVSDFANGPFDFVRSFYPDGNETHDQTVYQDETGTAFLARTYYATVDYILPAPVMQPMWESVKNRDGTTNFGLNYHRANYEPAYDDYHDIYLQRWRTENKQWQVICVNKETKVQRDVPYGEVNFDGEVCDDPTEYKLVRGQGQQGDDLAGVETRFLDPKDEENSWWKPTSVPSVVAQPWSKNYEDGTCGIRKLDNDMHEKDPDLGQRETGGREECSNIVDNAIHPTPPDLLIGVDTVVEQRRAKYVAISKLTDDFLDTSGVLMSFEGEMEDEADLITLLRNGGFGWESGDDLGSTFKPQVYTEFKMAQDWDTRFHQYEENFNDRAFYSLSCQLDGTCPVDFKDQVELGRAESSSNVAS